MPARGDHDARRRDVSEAVWKVLGRTGFGGLTIRAVAAELGSSTGLVSHYFPSKRDLVHHAYDVAEERGAVRVPERDTLRGALLDVLPLDENRLAMSRVWVSFWDAAIGDAALGERQRLRYVRWRDRLRPLVPGRDEDLVATVAAFAHGLVVQAVFDLDLFPAERQIALLDAFLETLPRR